MRRKLVILAILAVVATTALVAKSTAPAAASPGFGMCSGCHTANSQVGVSVTQTGATISYTITGPYTGGFGYGVYNSASAKVASGSGASGSLTASLPPGQYTFYGVNKDTASMDGYATQTFTVSAASTPTTVPPTATSTATRVPPTATATTVPPTATATATRVPPTATSTVGPPSATATNTPPAATATPTSVPPTATATATGVPPTRTPTTVPPTATATPAGTTPTPTATSTPVPPTRTPGPRNRSYWELEGRLDGIQGEVWTVDDVSILITASTRIEGGPPVVGDEIHAKGYIGSRGALKATEISVEKAEDNDRDRDRH